MTRTPADLCHSVPFVFFRVLSCVSWSGSLVLHAGAVPALVLVQAADSIRFELTRVKALVAALTDAAADPAELLAAGGVYHA